jgi:type II secretory pathway pseudopilin PulG
MTILELMIVIVIIALGASGLTLSLGALTRTALKSAAGRIAAAARFGYNRALVHGTTVRLAFELGGNTFSLEEAHGRVTLTRADDERAESSDTDDAQATSGAADPWAAAQARLSDALKPSLGASPFGPIATREGKTTSRYANVSLGRRVQIVRLIVAHEPAPREHGHGAIHFFPGGATEHAVVHLSDGGEGVFALEIHPLTGRATVHTGAYEPRDLLDDPRARDVSEVDE